MRTIWIDDDGKILKLEKNHKKVKPIDEDELVASWSSENRIEYYDTEGNSVKILENGKWVTPTGISKFPDRTCLAENPTDDVLELIEILGNIAEYKVKNVLKRAGIIMWSFTILIAVLATLASFQPDRNSPGVILGMAIGYIVIVGGLATLGSFLLTAIQSTLATNNRIKVKWIITFTIIVSIIAIVFATVGIYPQQPIL